MELVSFDVLDCHGRVSHRLRLELDGTVTIRFEGGPTAKVDPTRRQNLTPHVTVSPSLMDAAVSLTPFG